MDFPGIHETIYTMVRGEEGAGRVRLGGEEAKGGGNGDRGSKSTLDTLEEVCYYIYILIHI